MTRQQSMASNAMPTWLPLVAKIVGTVYLLEAPAIVVLRMIVLMFVPSKIDWIETFHGIQMQMWAVVLAAAAITHLASGVAGWVIGVWLARRRPNALRHWRLLVSWLLVQHLVWSIWIVLAFQGGTRYLLFTLLQGVLLLALGFYSWFNAPPVERNDTGRQIRHPIILSPQWRDPWTFLSKNPLIRSWIRRCINSYITVYSGRSWRGGCRAVSSSRRRARWPMS